MPNDVRKANLRHIKVMISSTRADLMQYRQVAAAVLDELQSVFRERVHIVIIGMETEDPDGGDKRPVAISKEWVEASDWVILIVGRHYGTITDEAGADGLSVTEWECRHARQLGKKVFVFLSGVMGSSEPYDSQGDTLNLSNWTEVQNDAQAAGLKAFRKKLEGAHAAFFRNAHHFEGRLRRTLTRAVLNLGLDLRNRALRELVTKLLDPKIKPCYRGVKQLYRSKEIHDAIHRLRQHALIQLCDRVERVKETGPLMKLVMGTVDLRRSVMEKAHQLKGDEVTARLKEKIKDLSRALEDLSEVDEQGKLLPIDQFRDQLDECFARLETAFDEANTAMQRRKGVFADLHEAMTSALETEGKSKLKPDELAQLKAEIELTKTNRDRLLTTLETHDAWQRIHGEIVNVTNMKTNQPVRRRERVAQAEAPLTLAISQIRAQAQQDDEDIAELDREFDKLTFAQQLLLKLPVTEPAEMHAEAWHNVCRAFDDCFFKVDERTLRIVGRSQERVDEMEASFKRAGIDTGSDD